MLKGNENVRVNVEDLMVPLTTINQMITMMLLMKSVHEKYSLSLNVENLFGICSFCSFLIKFIHRLAKKLRKVMDSVLECDK